MKIYSGSMVNSGIAMGRALLLNAPDYFIDKRDCADIEGEIRRLENAAALAVDDLENMQNRAVRMYGGDMEAVLSAHILILSDRTENSLIKRSIDYVRLNGVSAEYAVKLSGDELALELARNDSEYLSARSEDITHIKKLLLAKLLGKDITPVDTTDMNNSSEKSPRILLAEELSPETLSTCDPGCICAIATRTGSILSHTAILAKNMNIPYLTDVDFLSDGLITDETFLAVDAGKGILIAEPDDITREDLAEKIKINKRKAELDKNNAKEFMENSPIKLYANIGKPEEVYEAVENNAQGIGLFRSEFLYMDRDEAPDEDEQYEAYVKVLDAMQGKPVIIRTIDLGADKEARCVRLPKEANPALGMRGIRISFANHKLFTVQLRALLRAAYGRNLKIMFPMISSEQEVIKAIEQVRETAAALRKEGTACAVPPIGIMIETPASALIMDKLAEHVQFVSIGTNDLTQYTLALDRTGSSLSEYYIPHHEAILKLIDMTVKAAHEKGVLVGICGELGSDTELTETFKNMGIDELSMPAVRIADIASRINGL